ncbi:glycosyltransferase group 1 [Secundilactobacillus pentosiphilus]|uniref:Glycosyltransferase group 1 n=1 Tax=Secundilactobacillus pentosiphilus TaxID=1714682 RepID=A0A1Z5ISC5_9LACO|nr:glycosyltransferase group 1 [Secundilactobacillus pentosiphilus]
MPRLSGHGGTETVINYWTDFLGEKKHQIYDFKIIAPNGMDDSGWIHSRNFFKISHLMSPNRHIRHIQSLIVLIFSIFTISPDLVIVMNTTTLKVVYFLRNFFHLNFKISTWLHFSLKHGEGFDMKALVKADYHLCISQGIREQLADLNINDNVYVIGNPVDRKSKSIKLNPSIPRFIYVGRLMLNGQKNLIELLIACSGLIGDWKLDLYGTGPAAEISRIQSFLKKNNIESKVCFKGWLNNPWLTIESATALVLTSKFEGLPMVLLEACSYGLPVVSSDCPTGPGDIVKEDNGFLYSSGDTNQLRNILQLLIDQRASFETKKIKESINWFYTDQYFLRLNNDLNRF